LNGPKLFLSELQQIPTREPEHALVKTGRRSFLTRSSRSNQPTLILSSPFLLSLSGAVRSGVDRCQARFAQVWIAQVWIAVRRGSLRHGSLRRGSLSGAVRSGVDRSQARFAQAWLALGRGSLRRGSFAVGNTTFPLLGTLPSKRLLTIFGNGIQSERIPNTPAFQRACGECREQRVFVVVVIVEDVVM